MSFLPRDYQNANLYGLYKVVENFMNSPIERNGNFPFPRMKIIEREFVVITSTPDFIIKNKVPWSKVYDGKMMMTEEMRNELNEKESVFDYSFSEKALNILNLMELTCSDFVNKQSESDEQILSFYWNLKEKQIHYENIVTKRLAYDSKFRVTCGVGKENDENLNFNTDFQWLSASKLYCDHYGISFKAVEPNIYNSCFVGFGQSIAEVFFGTNLTRYTKLGYDHIAENLSHKYLPEKKRIEDYSTKQGLKEATYNTNLERIRSKRDENSQMHELTKQKEDLLKTPTREKQKLINPYKPTLINEHVITFSIQGGIMGLPVVTQLGQKGLKQAMSLLEYTYTNAMKLNIEAFVDLGKALLIRCGSKIIFDTGISSLKAGIMILRGFTIAFNIYNVAALFSLIWDLCDPRFRGVLTEEAISHVNTQMAQYYIRVFKYFHNTDFIQKKDIPFIDPIKFVYTYRVTPYSLLTSIFHDLLFKRDDHKFNIIYFNAVNNYLNSMKYNSDGQIILPENKVNLKKQPVTLQFIESAIQFNNFEKNVYRVEKMRNLMERTVDSKEMNDVIGWSKVYNTSVGLSIFGMIGVIFAGHMIIYNGKNIVKLFFFICVITLIIFITNKVIKGKYLDSYSHISRRFYLTNDYKNFK